MIVPPFDKLRVTGYEPALVMLSSSWSKRTTWKRMKMGLPTQRALGRALFSLQLVEG